MPFFARYISCKYFLHGACTRRRCPYQHTKEQAEHNAYNAWVKVCIEQLPVPREISKIMLGYMPVPRDQLVSFKELLDSVKDNKTIEDEYKNEFESTDLPENFLEDFRKIRVKYPSSSNDSNTRVAVIRPHYDDGDLRMPVAEPNNLQASCWSTEFNPQWKYFYCFTSGIEWRSQLLTMRIDPTSLNLYGPIRVLCHLIREMTFFGYKEKSSRDRARNTFSLRKGKRNSLTVST